MAPRPRGLITWVGVERFESPHVSLLFSPLQNFDIILAARVSLACAFDFTDWKQTAWIYSYGLERPLYHSILYELGDASPAPTRTTFVFLVGVVQCASCARKHFTNMWILDTDTDLLGGRRRWLRPGSESILGRTNFEGPTQKAISRRHIVMAVEKVPKDEGLSIRYHSKLTLKDESKKGSTIDGEFINGSSVVMDPATEHSFQMASAPQIFRIKYEPQVFTVHLSGKKKVNLKTALKDYLDKLEQLDIKCVAEFLPGTTTVVVVTKRNLPVSLRALINGAWIVTSAFVDALVAAATQPTADNGEPLDSPLQLDISENWPDPINFLPPPGQEPNPKAPDFFKPNPTRKTMFEKWAVICCTTQHMDIFAGVVADAGGKIEFFELKEGKTKPAELIVHLDKLKRKWIVLAPNTDDIWHANFRKDVEARTSIRFAEQNEFLDAILNADPTMLARPYEPETQASLHESVEIPSAPPLSEAAAKGSQPVGRRTRAHDKEESKGEHSQIMEPPARPSAESSMRRTQTTQSRTSRYVSQIKLDDSDDDNFVPLPAPVSSSATSVKAASQGSKTTSRGVSFSQAAGRGTQLSAISESQGLSQGLSQGTKKRRSMPSDDEEDEDIMDRMLAGQAAMKKRKIAEEAKKSVEPAKPVKQLPSIQKKLDMPAQPVKPEPIEEEGDDMDMKPAKGKMKAVDSKVIKTAQEIRRKEEAEAALEDAANEMSPDEIAAVAKMRDLAIVEVFEVVVRTDRPTTRSQAYGDEGDRWDETWNGRKNFKKFKRRNRDGEAEGPMRRMGGHIMVPLVEHKAKDYGIGESYWIDKSTGSSKGRNNNSSVVSHVSETQLLMAPMPRSSKILPEVQEISDDDEDLIEEEETARDDSPVVRRSQPTKSRAAAQNTQSSTRGTARSIVHSSIPIATQTSVARSAARSKRTTSNRNSVSEEPARKKTKTRSSMFNDSEEDSDDDELKFKFK
ncbi:hypothetical protein H072_2129 [Dactylellina haptotyla CBS 200.50]|uniref:FHA domain-containing protein n=1 Tax=Dactylellina haptotyla (strain CBS 200.50) TaxID=1284197 RepID=S8C7Y4_DACHA|nr:hypothetical protein H072_2129 [Dactylellina haptotyla CBS 200.50]